MEFRQDLKHEIIDNPEFRYCEIYKITNLQNGKLYVGQAVSHILNHKRYRPYGMEGRFRCHISEAFSQKTKQCHYLNSAIRKYGKESFKVELIKICSIEDADKSETEEILKNNSLFPNGYNLTTGGLSSKHTEESKKRVSNGVSEYFKDKKIQRFIGVKIDDTNLDKHLRPLRRENKQYGWYVYVNKKTAHFGGVHISLEESKKQAINFIEEIKRVNSETP